MSNFAQQSKSDTANFLVNRGFAERIAAASLGAEHVGRALMNEVWRDHEFLHISAVTVDGDNVTIEYLTIATPTGVKTNVPLEVEGKTGTVATDVSDVIVTRNLYVVPAGSEIVISKDVVPRPVGRRVTVVITRETSEVPLDDIIAPAPEPAPESEAK